MKEYIITVRDEKILPDGGVPLTMIQEIVRCRDCVHSYLFDMSWKSPKTNDKRYCKYGSYLKYEVPDDGFCAWGERRDA